MIRTAVVMVLGVFLAGAVGCKGGEATRATVGFQAEGVRLNLKMLRNQVPKQSDLYGMLSATDGLRRALDGLPERVRQEATTRKEERMATATKARRHFDAMIPVLNSMKYEQAAMNAKLDELERMVSEVEKS